ncbi:nuclear transport factor 2 family protein [Streptomyces sp. NPDC093018]|uniref:nuclear transport factor 2 family protein n=1 Tax=Streptomyces sp. NPDC093018 TaxID=3155067 RepID=UPI003415211C
MSDTPAGTVTAFLDAVRRGSVAEAMALVDPSAVVSLYPLGTVGAAPAALRDWVVSTGTAFPDLRLTLTHLVECGRVVGAELKLEGTQAADYLGAVNQEKHIDLDQAWRFTVTDGRITTVDGYWCQNQLYRRLGVKRLDQVAIVTGGAV